LEEDNFFRWQDCQHGLAHCQLILEGVAFNFAMASFFAEYRRACG
jgi:hypothetical protein